MILPPKFYVVIDEISEDEQNQVSAEQLPTASVAPVNRPSSNNDNKVNKKEDSSPKNLSDELPPQEETPDGTLPPLLLAAFEMEAEELLDALSHPPNLSFEALLAELIVQEPPSGDSNPSVPNPFDASSSAAEDDSSDEDFSPPTKKRRTSWQ